MAQGYRHVRVQLAAPGFSGYGVSGAKTSDEAQKMRPEGVAPSPVFEPTPYVNNTIRMFEHLRAKLGFDVELLHDVHERVPPAQALQLAKALEPYRLFFLEDAFAPEDVAWFQIMRQQTTTPLAMGELFVNRQRVAAAGHQPLDRFRPAPHLGGRRAEHGAQDRRLLRVLQCAHRLARAGQRFPGRPCGQHASGSRQPQLRHPGAEPFFAGGPRSLPRRARDQGRLHVLRTTSPGLGIDIDEKAAARFPYKQPGGSRGNDRRLDGTIVRP